MYRSFELIYEVLNQTHGVMIFFCVYMLNGMLTIVYSLWLCICLNTMLNV
jgi:hypothetical protein